MYISIDFLAILGVYSLSLLVISLILNLYGAGKERDSTKALLYLVMQVPVCYYLWVAIHLPH